MSNIPLSRASVAGPKLSDLIAALQMLDPDARHGIAEVRTHRILRGGGEIRSVELIGENGDVFVPVEEFRDDPEEA